MAPSGNARGGRVSVRTQLTLIVAWTLIVAGCADVPETPVVASENAATTVAPDSMVTVTMQRIRTGPPISGELRATREATVRAEVAGSLVDLSVEEGQAVRRGQVLCRIDAHALGNAHESAEVAVRSAADALDVAEREEQRAQALAADGLVAQRDVEVARKAVAQAQAQLADAHAKLAAAGEQSAKAVVRAPMTGVVSKRVANAGDVVIPGAPLMSILDPSSLRLEASVSGQALGVLSVGAPVEFSVDGYDEQVFTGRIDRISPSADPVTRQVRIQVSVPNVSRRLVAGLFAQGRVTAASREGLVVPAAAVDMNGTTPWVLRLRDGKAERVPVAIGLRDERDGRVEIRLGVAEGDALLTGAAQAITPGTLVQIAGERRMASVR